MQTDTDEMSVLKITEARVTEKTKSDSVIIFVEVSKNVVSVFYFCLPITPAPLWIEMEQIVLSLQTLHTCVSLWTFGQDSSSAVNRSR